MIRSIDKNPSRSINYYLKVLLIIIVIILLINMLISMLTLSITRKQSIDTITNTVNLYIENVRSNLNAVDHFMIWTVVHEPLIEEMEENMGMDKFPQNLTNFRTRVNDFQYSIGKEYQFFLGLKEGSFFSNASPIKLPYQDYLQVKNYFFSQNDSLHTYEIFSTWKAIKINETFYFYHLVSYENRIFVCLVSAEDLLKPLNSFNLGSNGSIVIKQEGKTILTTNQQMGEEETASYHFFTSKLLFQEKNILLPFSLQINVDHFGAFKHVVITQVILILATIVISIILFFILLYIKNRLIFPIQKFSKNLSEINNNRNMINFESNSIIELEQANTQFKNLIQEIKKLKINIYEQELEKKRIEMDFLRLQIKPHFYINCLSSIHSMAEMQMFTEIKKMSIATSRYFRYLFQTNHHFVSLKKELDHIRDYLAIQQLLHGPTFQYKTSIRLNIEEMQIPPLILQTFIENSIKHGFSDINYEETLIISLSITPAKDEQKLNITIKDNGPGYPPDILDKLQNQLPISAANGKQIGINNAIQRLQMLYGNSFSISFSNGMNDGAIVELVIPTQLMEE
ncbi:MAG: histidine kinase [Bacillus sp. (in: Bacteria)]|uniref:sensor histidine kinase n=1 Tax=Niallia sp. FSL W8-1348 TaxID=2954656 RepID=UPI0030F6CBF8|nr:histidine kinase [Bacillus sp. (in: firmicutes)]